MLHYTLGAEHKSIVASSLFQCIQDPELPLHVPLRYSHNVAQSTYRIADLPIMFQAATPLPGRRPARRSGSTCYTDTSDRRA